MSIEIWKDIAGYEGFYQASNLGNIKSLSKKVSNGQGSFIKKEKVLKPYMNKDGYFTVNLYNGKKKTLYSVHRLIALTFIENPEGKPTVNHKNSIRTDNNILNLEWNTYSENNHHAFDKGFKKPMKGDKCWIYNINPDSHPNSKDVINIKTGKVYKSLKTACIEEGVKYSTMLSKISLKGKGKNTTDLMYLSELNEMPDKIIIKIGNKEFNFNSEYKSNWVKIESVEDFPKHSTYIETILNCYKIDDPKAQGMHHFIIGDEKFLLEKISHYRVIPFIPPIY